MIFSETGIDFGIMRQERRNRVSKISLIAGPTASGKSALALATRGKAPWRHRQRRFHAGLSRSAHHYRAAGRRTRKSGRRTGSMAMSTPRKITRSAAGSAEAAAALADRRGRDGRPAIVAGGTGLYFSALTAGHRRRCRRSRRKFAARSAAQRALPKRGRGAPPCRAQPGATRRPRRGLRPGRTAPRDRARAGSAWWRPGARSTRLAPRTARRRRVDPAAARPRSSSTPEARRRSGPRHRRAVRRHDGGRRPGRSRARSRRAISIPTCRR